MREIWMKNSISAIKLLVALTRLRGKNDSKNANISHTPFITEF